jgi:hypothetical protein
MSSAMLSMRTGFAARIFGISIDDDSMATIHLDLTDETLPSFKRALFGSGSVYASITRYYAGPVAPTATLQRKWNAVAATDFPPTAVIRSATEVHQFRQIDKNWLHQPFDYLFPSPRGVSILSQTGHFDPEVWVGILRFSKSDWGVPEIYLAATRLKGIAFAVPYRNHDDDPMVLDIVGRRQHVESFYKALCRELGL